MPVNVLGYSLYAFYLVDGSDVLAYSLGFTFENAYKHLLKIKKYHKLKGSIKSNTSLDRKFEEIIKGVIFKNKYPEILPDLEIYRHWEIYEELIYVPAGKVVTYSWLAEKTKKSIVTVMKTLAYNPFIILIPCHRVIRKDGKLSGYTPLGKEFKKKLLEAEGYLKT